MSRCDFCQDDAPRWEYRCPDFEVTLVAVSARANAAAVIPWRSKGSWNACDPCSAFIDAGQWAALSERALKVACEKADREGKPFSRGNRRELRKALRTMHGEFRRLHQGPALDLHLIGGRR